jgi:uncharacterized paraquat-inducible protein A
VSLHRGIDGPEPARGAGEVQEERRIADASRLATGTLACPRCDAPVALAPGSVSPAHRLACPYCRHVAAVRDFLSLAAPSRPARVAVRVVAHGRAMKR